MGGAKSLSKGLAVGAVELIFNVIFKVGGSIFSAIKAIIKGIIKAIKYLVKGAIKLLKKGVQLVLKVLKSSKIAGSYLVKKGKYVFQGVQKGFSRGAKSLKDLKNRILGRFKFKKFKVVRNGHWIELWGEVNPYFLVMTTKIDEVTDPKEIDQLSKRLKGKELKNDFKAGERGNKGFEWDNATKKGDITSSGNPDRTIVKIDSAEVDNVAANHLGMNKKEFATLASKADGEAYKGVKVIDKGGNRYYVKDDIRVRMPTAKRTGTSTMNLEVKDASKTWLDIDKMALSGTMNDASNFRLNVHLDVH